MTRLSASRSPQVPVLCGKLIDKITILEIKSERLTEQRALANVRTSRRLRQCWPIATPNYPE